MTTLPLERCTDCRIELQPNWKFCVACGTPVPRAAELPAPVIRTERPIPTVLAEPPAPIKPVAPAQQAIPGAIRSTAAHAIGEMPRRTINVPAIVSVVLGVAGVALIIYLIVLVFGSRH